MTVRRLLLALVLLAVASHLFAIQRTLLPAQDGLKFIRVAHQFQVNPWADVVRGTDQHPLYPALVALAEPMVAAVLGHGPDTWRIAAQGVASVSSLLLLIPLFYLTRSLFDERVGVLAVLIYILLPLPAAVGHDTLSDSLALLAALTALAFGERALRSNGWVAPVGCGIAAGLGYMARPEVLIVPVAVVLVSATCWRWPSIAPRLVPRFSALALTFLVMVGSYTLVKGEVSEKLALRRSAALAPAASARKTEQWLPPGLRDARWDFSPKEESEEPETAGLWATTTWLFFHWSEALCGIFAFFGVWGVARADYIRKALSEGRDDTPEFSPFGSRLVAVYLCLFSLVLVRHALRMGYLSDRHILTLVAASIPWAAAGTFICATRFAAKLRWNPRVSRIMAALAIMALVGASGYLQSKRSHVSRWGHWAAGRWLKANAGPQDVVLDTRGWAAFVSGKPSYDYWHVRQALTDSHLAYVVVGTRELSADSRRAATLRAVLAYAATPVVEFPERRDGGSNGVRVYRYQRPNTWEGIQE